MTVFFVVLDYDWRREMGLPQYVPMDQIARALGCCERHVRQLCINGDIPAIKVGRLWRIPEAEFLKWLESGGSRPNVRGR